ncbi:MAG: choice-of-anchor V domain-containing protein [Bacteroidota bacterium]
MTKLYTRATLLCVGILLAISTTVFTNTGGAPSGNTAAPGDGNCTGCHSGSLITSGADWNNFTITSTVPVGGYVPGTTYTITISHTQSGINKWGFQATVLNSSNAMAGSIINTNTSQMSTQTIAGKTYIGHTSGGTSGSGTKSWSFDWTAPSPGAGTVTVYAVVNATNSNSSTSGDLIYARNLAFTQQGQGPPVATLTSSRDTICAGDTVQFNGSGTNNPLSYSWQFIGGTPSSSTQQNPKVVYLNAGSYTARLIASNSFGSSSPVTKTIVVNARPSATISPAGALTICGNDSVQLTSSTNTGIQFLWTPGNSVSSSVYATQSGNYSVRITDANGCRTQSNTVAVTKRSKPVVTLQANKLTTCSNDSVTFTALPAGLSSYQFKTLGLSLRQSASNQFKTLLILPLSNVYVIATDSFGCKSDSTNGVNVAVQTAPAGPIVTCDSVSLTFIRFRWTPVASALGYEVSLDSGRTWSTPTSGNLGLTHSLSGLPQGTRVSLFVRAIISGLVCTRSMAGIGSCQTPGCITISYTVQYDSVRQVCAGLSSDTVSVSITGANVNPYVYRVEEVSENGNVLRVVIPVSVSSTMRLPVVPNGINRFRINLYDAALTGCDTVRKTIAIRTQQSAGLPVELTFNKLSQIYCSSDTAVLSTTALPEKQVYELYRNNTLVFSDTATKWKLTPLLAPDGSVFRVVAKDTVKGCILVSDARLLTRKQQYASLFSYEQTGTTNITFTDTTPTSVSRLWLFGDGNIDTAKVTTHTYAAFGDYDVALITRDIDQCVSNSPIVTISVLPTSVGSVLDAAGIQVYPNPAKGQLTIESDKLLQSVTLTTLTGQALDILMTFDGKSSYSLDCSTYTEGLYLIKIKTNDATYIKRFVISNNK